MIALSGSDPLAGFGQGILLDIYLLQVKTGNARLDDALYSLAHPNARDAIPNATHQDVVRALRAIAEAYDAYGEVATKLADAYEAEFCPPAP